MSEEQEGLPMFSISDEDNLGEKDSYPDLIPVLPLRNTVLFPGIVLPITIGRDKSINSIKKANKGEKWIAVVSQKNKEIEEASAEHLNDVGTVAKILKVIKMPDGSTTAILQGRRKVLIKEYKEDEHSIEAYTEMVLDVLPDEKIEFNARVASIKEMARKIIKLSPKIPSDAVIMLENIKNNVFLLNFIASNISMSLTTKQELLEETDVLKKGDRIIKLMNEELKLLQLKSNIESKVKGDIEKQQRDYFLNQQLKTIQDELGQNPQTEALMELIKKADAKKWPKEAKEAFDKEIQKAKRINPQIAEYSVILNYLELMVELPWEDFTNDNFDLKEVQKVLDKDHFGLQDVKKRIIEHLAVLKLKGDMKAPIICLVGPPGVGKTSLGKSIGRALNREFIRMSLGGLHDESEIRGHRKTYIGARPGRILQSIKKAGSGNPVFILDEIDKIGKDFRGDPSSALLEVLDPEQNEKFYDNYLELEYDLSKVLFIATANSLSTIQPALLDRMEIIQISGYSTEEKVQIAKKHLIAKQRKAHGLKANQIKLNDGVLTDVITKYTRESGVRSLDREVGSIMRSIAKHVAMEESYEINVKKEDLKTLIGPSKYSKELYAQVDTSGVAVGLAWTRVGGDILFIESILSKGKGKLTLTGNLGDVMKESATTALSYIKASAEKIGIDPDEFDKKDIHVHVPEGAIPKDGPSAGITMLTAISSTFLNKKVKPYLAMTGEITLRGKVLPVGGIKEKILAAKRAGLKEVMMCYENKKHVEEIDEVYLKGLKFHYVKTMDEVLAVALGV